MRGAWTLTASPVFALAMPADARPIRGKPQAVAHDEAEAWRLFTDNVGFVSRTLRYLGVGDSELEDVAQEVFLIAHQRRSEFEGRAAIRTWLYRICWNTAANHRRKLARARERNEPLSSEPAVEATQERELSRRRARDQLSALLDLLDDDKRAVFVLYEIEQLSMREVAEVVGCPLQTGYSRLKSAHRIVKEAAAKMGGAGNE